MGRKKKEMTPAQKAAARRVSPEERARQAAEQNADEQREPGRNPLLGIAGGIAGIVLICLVAGFGYAFTSGV